MAKIAIVRQNADAESSTYLYNRLVSLGHIVDIYDYATASTNMSQFKAFVRTYEMLFGIGGHLAMPLISGEILDNDDKALLERTGTYLALEKKWNEMRTVIVAGATALDTENAVNSYLDGQIVRMKLDINIEANPNLQNIIITSQTKLPEFTGQTVTNVFASGNTLYYSLSGQPATGLFVFSAGAVLAAIILLILPLGLYGLTLLYFGIFGQSTLKTTLVADMGNDMMQSCQERFDSGELSEDGFIECMRTAIEQTAEEIPEYGGFMEQVMMIIMLAIVGVIGITAIPLITKIIPKSKKD